MNNRPALNVSSQAGMTMLELMIVLAIVAILVAMAVPAYMDYAIRSKVAECINSAAVPKVQLTEFRQSLGAWPATLSEGGLTNSGLSQFCDGYVGYDASAGSFVIDVDEAAISGSISGELAPRMIPTVLPSNAVDWRCTKGITPAINVKYLPSSCRGT